MAALNQRRLSNESSSSRHSQEKRDVRRYNSQQQHQQPQGMHSSSSFQHEPRGRNQHYHSGHRGYQQTNSDDEDEYSDSGYDLSHSRQSQQERLQPSFMKPFQNLLAGKKGAYSKVPTASGESPKAMTRSSSSTAASSSRKHPSSSGRATQPQLRHRYEDAAAAADVADEYDDEYDAYQEEQAQLRLRNTEDYDTDEETDKLLEKGYMGQRQLQLPELAEHALNQKPKVTMKEGQFFYIFLNFLFFLSFIHSILVFIHNLRYSLVDFNSFILVSSLDG